MHQGNVPYTFGADIAAWPLRRIRDSDRHTIDCTDTWILPTTSTTPTTSALRRIAPPAYLPTIAARFASTIHSNPPYAPLARTYRALLSTALSVEPIQRKNHNHARRLEPLTVARRPTNREPRRRSRRLTFSPADRPAPCTAFFPFFWKYRDGFAATGFTAYAIAP